MKICFSGFHETIMLIDSLLNTFILGNTCSLPIIFIYICIFISSSKLILNRWYRLYIIFFSFSLRVLISLIHLSLISIQIRINFFSRLCFWCIVLFPNTIIWLFNYRPPINWFRFIIFFLQLFLHFFSYVLFICSIAVFWRLFNNYFKFSLSIINFFRWY